MHDRDLEPARKPALHDASDTAIIELDALALAHFNASGSVQPMAGAAGSRARSAGSVGQQAGLRRRPSAGSARSNGVAPR
jgi:hypothetical protein